jgi:hypothetical protein
MTIKGVSFHPSRGGQFSAVVDSLQGTASVRAVGSQLGSHPSMANALTAARLREVFGQDRALSDADAELLAATACMAPAAGLDAPVRLIWDPTGAAAVLAGRQCPLLSVILRWNVAPGSRP